MKNLTFGAKIVEGGREGLSAITKGRIHMQLVKTLVTAAICAAGMLYLILLLGCFTTSDREKEASRRVESESPSTTTESSKTATAFPPLDYNEYELRYPAEKDRSRYRHERANSYEARKSVNELTSSEVQTAFFYAVEDYVRAEDRADTTVANAMKERIQQLLPRMRGEVTMPVNGVGYGAVSDYFDDFALSSATMDKYIDDAVQKYQNVWGGTMPRMNQ